MGELASNNYGGGTPKTSVDAYWNGDIPWFQSSDLTEGDILNVKPQKHISELGLKNSAAKVIPKNSIAIVTRVGVGKLSIVPFSFATSQDFLSLSKFDADITFSAYVIYKKIQNDLNDVQGTSIKGITKADLLLKNVSIPNQILEQRDIGAFLELIDHTLTLHQRKLDKLQELKKAFQDLIFNQQLRFAGFSDVWVFRKLGEITKSYSGGTPSVLRKEYYNGHIPFIRSAEINSNTTEMFLTESGLANSSAKMVCAGDILYALYGATSGEVGIAQIQGAINQAILAIIPDDGYDSQFLMQWLRGQKQNIIDKYLQGGQGNLSGSLVKDLHVKLPDYVEQQKIGSILLELDNLITLHQGNIDKICDLKKVFLCSMFI